MNRFTRMLSEFNSDDLFCVPASVSSSSSSSSSSSDGDKQQQQQQQVPRRRKSRDNDDEEDEEKRGHEEKAAAAAAVAGNGNDSEAVAVDAAAQSAMEVSASKLFELREAELQAQHDDEAEQEQHDKSSPQQLVKKQSSDAAEPDPAKPKHVDPTDQNGESYLGGWRKKSASSPSKTTKTTTSITQTGTNTSNATTTTTTTTTTATTSSSPNNGDENGENNNQDDDDDASSVHTDDAHFDDFDRHNNDDLMSGSSFDATVTYRAPPRIYPWVQPYIWSCLVQSPNQWVAYGPNDQVTIESAHQAGEPHAEITLHGNRVFRVVFESMRQVSATNSGPARRVVRLNVQDLSQIDEVAETGPLLLLSRQIGGFACPLAGVVDDKLTRMTRRARYIKPEVVARLPTSTAEEALRSGAISLEHRCFVCLELLAKDEQDGKKNSNNSGGNNGVDDDADETEPSNGDSSSNNNQKKQLTMLLPCFHLICSSCAKEYFAFVSENCPGCGVGIEVPRG